MLAEKPYWTCGKRNKKKTLFSLLAALPMKALALILCVIIDG